MDENPPIIVHKHDLLIPLNSFYLFSETFATVIDGNEKHIQPLVVLNVIVCMSLKDAVR